MRRTVSSAHGELRHGGGCYLLEWTECIKECEFASPVTIIQHNVITDAFDLSVNHSNKGNGLSDKRCALISF